MFENTGNDGGLTNTNGFGFSCFENTEVSDNGVAGFFQSEKPLDDEIQSFEK